MMKDKELKSMRELYEIRGMELKKKQIMP